MQFTRYVYCAYFSLFGFRRWQKTSKRSRRAVAKSDFVFVDFPARGVPDRNTGPDVFLLFPPEQTLPLQRAIDFTVHMDPHNPRSYFSDERTKILYTYIHVSKYLRNSFMIERVSYVYGIPQTPSYRGSRYTATPCAPAQVERFRETTWTRVRQRKG